MSKFKLVELKSEGEKNYYLEGYVSTTEPDFAKDVVDEKGQESTYNEINGKNITMDEDHEEWRDPDTGKFYDGKKDKFPIAKVIETKLDSKGTWIKAMLNKHHPNFEKHILPSIKTGFLHSFSIAYKALRYFYDVINGIRHRFIQSVAVANIGITGNPINKGSTFTIALKSFSKKMVEENQKAEIEKENLELKSKVQDFEKELTELKSKHDDLVASKEKEVTELKSALEKAEEGSSEDGTKKEKTEDEKAELKSFKAEFTELKSTVDELKKENTELKSVIESPQLKSLVNPQNKDPANADKPVDMWEIMG